MNHIDFAQYDLNLLVAFDALHVERSVSIAAKRMNVSQSAMSQSLRRLRLAFGDELFVRTPRGVEPTSLADELAVPIRETLQKAHGLFVARAGFEPRTADRRFKIALSDSHQLLFLPELMETLLRDAPGVALHAIPYEKDHVDRQLDAGEVDLVIGQFDASDVRHPCETLFDETLVCLFNPRLVRLSRPPTLAEYLHHPHVLISHGGPASGIVDALLPKKSAPRHVALATPYAQALPFILERIAAIGLVPARLAAHCAKAGTLATATPPVKIAPYAVGMKWHARTTGDAGMQWLRAQFVRIAAHDVAATKPRRAAARKPKR